MRPALRKWLVPLALLVAVVIVLLLSAGRHGGIFSLRKVEMTSQEELNGWLEEQAQAAKDFYGEHEELFHRIADAARAKDETALAEGLEEIKVLGIAQYGEELRFGYAFEEFPTAIYCHVNICYEGYETGGFRKDLGDGWCIEANYIFMYGL